MSSYLHHLTSMYSPETFQRKIEYIKYNIFPHFSDSLTSKTTFLEIGPGLGELVSTVNSMTKGKIDVIDNDATVLQYVENKYKIQRSFQTEDVSLIDKKLGMYDYVVGIHVLEHIPPSQYEKVLKTLVKHVKPGGKIIFVVPNGNNPLGLVERYGDLQHYALFTTRSFLDFVALADSKDLEAHVLGYHIPPYTLLNILRIGMQKILHAFLIGMLMMNAGIFFTVMTPNSMVVIQKKKS